MLIWTGDADSSIYFSDIGGGISCFPNGDRYTFLPSTTAVYEVLSLPRLQLVILEWYTGLYSTFFTSPVFEKAVN